MSHGFSPNSQKASSRPQRHSQVDRGCSGPPHAMGHHRKLVIEMDVDVLVAPAARKAGCDQGVVQLATLETRIRRCSGKRPSRAPPRTSRRG